jgi:hypothetical protein
MVQGSNRLTSEDGKPVNTYFCKIISVNESLYKVAPHFHVGGKAKLDRRTPAAITQMFLLGTGCL